MVDPTILSGSGLGSSPPNIDPNIDQLTDVQKLLLNGGLLQQTNHVDPFGNTSTAYAGMQNPHDASIKEIANAINSQKAKIDANGYVAEIGRNLTAQELDNMRVIEDGMKDFTFMTNRQSGMNIDNLTSNPWNLIGGVNFQAPTLDVIPGVSEMLAMSSAMNRMNYAMNANQRRFTEGPCAAVEGIFGAIYKAGAILAKILAAIASAVGLLSFLTGILNLVKQLVGLVLNDIGNIGYTLASLKQKAFAALLDLLRQDPCLAYLLETFIAGAGIVSILKGKPGSTFPSF
tara:strand:- start:10615 stop:11478 length:864 start_codon:yes stop_codon:yes gene_type:complete